ncbi:GNAT family N-acetyltransferase [Deinococcus maricopensis]|uniref:GNAT family N-acetyltransferase n=1 Tax=Deinococcus maricopensis TaxID=309887 RepID=UPI0005C16ADF|nr:GNAT family N-acetyltransferase [Deinococcus maricopensis]
MPLIRTLTPDDAYAYGNTRLEALERDPQAYGSSAEEHRQLTVAHLQARIADVPGGNFTVGAFQGDALRGMATFIRHTARNTRHSGTVVGVYVGAELRGQGVGRHLLTLLLDRLRTYDDLERVTLSVTTTQTAARALYRTLGFVPYGLEPGALKVNGVLFDEEHLVLALR